MPIKLHKTEEGPAPASMDDRPRVTKTRGFPRFVLWLLVAIVVVLGVYFAFTWSRIQVRGRVTAAFGEYVAESPCRITKVDAAVGKPVKEGDVLVVSESIDFKSQVGAYEAALEQAKLRLALAEKGGDVGVVNPDTRPKMLIDAREAADVAAARESAAEKSEKEYADLVTAIRADRAKEIEKASADLATGAEKLKQAQASQQEVAVTLQQATKNFERAKRLKEQDAITVGDFEQAETKFNFAQATADKASSAVVEAQASLEGIKNVLEAVKKKYDAELAAQESRYARAQADTEVARAFTKHAKENQARMEAAFAGVKSDPAKMQADEVGLLKQGVTEAQERLDYFKAMAGTLAYKAPFSGIVCELNKSVGDVAEKYERVVAVYDPNTVAIEVYVPEDDFDRVHVGQVCHVAVRGTKIRFDGQVLSINSSPARLPGEMKSTPAPETAFDRFVTCRISVPDEFKKQISPSMRANVTIRTW